jgi:hypothetical protein
MKHKWNFQSCVIQSRYYISELCSNFNNMSDKSKFYYLVIYIITHEDHFGLNQHYARECKMRKLTTVVNGRKAEQKSACPFLR